MKDILFTSSALILALLALRRVFRRSISRQIQYALWLLVLVRLLVPVNVGRLAHNVLTVAAPVQTAVEERLDTPVMYVRNGTEQPPVQLVDDNTPQDEPLSPPSGTAQPAPADEFYTVTPTYRTVTLSEALTYVWYAGMVGAGAWFLFTNLRFARALRRTRTPYRVESCRYPVYLVPGLSSPCLFGVLRPAIYLNAAAASSPETLRFVLAHEQTHARHLDPLWSLLRGVCLTVYWFDPLVWYAALCSREDCELACDEGTLRRLGTDERTAYGKTLLSLIPVCGRAQDPLLGATTMTAGKKSLRERITRIAENRQAKAAAVLAVAALAALVCAVSFTGASDTPPEVTQEWYDAGFSEEDARSCLEFLDWAKELKSSRIKGCNTWDAATGAAKFLLNDPSDEVSGQMDTLVDILRSIRASELSPPSAFYPVTLTLSIGDRRAGFSFSLSEGGQVKLIAPAEYSGYETEGKTFTYGKPVAIVDNAALAQFLLRLSGKNTSSYPSMEDYVLAFVDRLKQPNGYSYEVIPEDSDGVNAMYKTVTEAAVDVRVTELTQAGTCTELVGDGVLELWRFCYEVKPENKGGYLPGRLRTPGGTRISDDGYIFDGQTHYLAMLRTNGSPGAYRLLDDRASDDGLLSYYGCVYEDAYEYLYDLYADSVNLDVPRYKRAAYFGDGVDGQRYDGDGWCIYAPSDWTFTPQWTQWTAPFGAEDGTAAHFAITAATESAESIKAYYASIGAWRFDTDMRAPRDYYYNVGGGYDTAPGYAHEELYFIPVDDSSCYVLHCYSVNGFTPEQEKNILRQMTQSFMVGDFKNLYIPSFKTDIALASGNGAAALELSNGSGSHTYLLSDTLLAPDLTQYRYAPCDAPAENGSTLTLWLANNDSSWFVCYEGTNVIGYFAGGMGEGEYYTVDGDFSIIGHDGRTFYDVMRTWYDEAELNTLRSEIGPLDKSLSWQEAAQQWADRYEGVHLNATTGSEYRYTWVETHITPAEETAAALRAEGVIDENTYCFSTATAFVPESEWALSRSMAGNTGPCEVIADAPDGAYEYYRCCVIRLEDDGWHGEMWGTGW